MNQFYFDEKNTFCISLDSNMKRWEHMRERFQYFNLAVTRSRAATKADLREHFSGGLNDGQKGCAQSHINLWRHILEQNLDYALILEDDACFDKTWREKLEEFSNTIQDEHWDIIMLNASEPMEQQHTWARVTEQYLTAGYIISRKGAKTVLEMFQHCFCSSDWMTSRLQERRHGYCYFPWLIIQEGSDSCIGSNLEADREKVQRCLGEINYSLDNYI